MKKAISGLLCAALLLLPGCTQATAEADDILTVVATTYPVYLFTTAVVGDAEGVEVLRLVKEPTSCLHDYTLTVEDMKTIERADVIVVSGAGLEDFMASALARSTAPVIDCSEGIDLLLSAEHEGHDGHDHEEEYDPHIWMAPRNARRMVENIAAGLSALDRDHEMDYERGRNAALTQLDQADPYTWDVAFPSYGLVTFHDGFQYFARAYGFTLLAAIEEEEGSTASAAEIKEIAALIEQRGIPAIFVEKNGSRATANVIARETGCAVYELDMVMSGDGTGMGPYVDAILGNYFTILEAMG